MSILGHEVLRVEDKRMLTSGGRYVADLAPEGTAWVTFVRSHFAHARIDNIDVSKALAMPGVLAVVTGADLGLPSIKPMMAPAAYARPLLAREVVRFVGEAIAAVVTEQPCQGADAAEMVEVDYEPLPIVVDVEDSLLGDVLMFEDTESNVVSAIPGGQPIDFEGCEVVVRERLVNPRMAACPIEPRCGIAYEADDGRLTVISAVQGAHGARAKVAGVLGLSLEQVHAIVPDVGGGFGAKGSPSPEECILGRLSQLVRRPVTWVETRTENLLAGGHGRAQVQYATIGGRRDGTITHYRLEILQDAGAYAEFGSALPMFTRLMAPGVYDIAHVECSTRSVLTNTAPTLPFRGAGRPEATAAIERMVDRFAAEIGMDPAEVRRCNVVRPDQFPFTTATAATYDVGAYESALATVLDAAGYSELRADQARRCAANERVQLGIGLSSYVEVTSPAVSPTLSEFGAIAVDVTGNVVVRSGATPFGQGHVTTWKMIVADRLGVRMDAVTVIHGDTDAIPHSQITGGSRSVQIAGSALHDAAGKLVELARPRAAELLEASVADVQFDRERGVFHVLGTPARTVGWAALAAAEKAPLETESDWAQQGPTFPFGAHLAVVEVDTETGAVRLVRLVAVDDAGTLINPQIAHGQVHGGLASGAAQAFVEAVSYDEDGNLLTSNFADYGIISAAELPSFELVDHETPTPMNPLGAKGIGESGTVGSTPAVQNAVIDALATFGIRHLDMPLTSERVWRALAGARAPMSGEGIPSR